MANLSVHAKWSNIIWNNVSETTKRNHEEKNEKNLKPKMNRSYLEPLKLCESSMKKFIYILEAQYLLSCNDRFSKYPPAEDFDGAKASKIQSFYRAM